MSERLQQFVAMRETAQVARRQWLAVEQDYSISRADCDAFKAIYSSAQREFEAFAYQSEVKREVVAALKSGGIAMSV